MKHEEIEKIRVQYWEDELILRLIRDYELLQKWAQADLDRKKLKLDFDEGCG